MLFHSAGVENDNKGNKLNSTKAFAVGEKSETYFTENGRGEVEAEAAGYE